ncbi:DUF7541 family protein [Natrinema halophilum]|uniref:Cox cluster protein n=1 Tax=Natrinema halophilum TaxID=1699371 RepID=A0A7D5GJL0_9EURY|nr:hypothetical protein [Natrinema halophilum]QLG50728.1 hypothetical protein HYG82_18745 [Natrinema halophilum]
MADHSTPGERTDAARPWPMLVALGLAASEVGIVVDFGPIAVGGLVVFAASVAGILSDAAYVERPAEFAATFGGVFVFVGAVLAAQGTGTLSIAPLEPLSGLASRGIALVVAGFLTILGAGIVRIR